MNQRALQVTLIVLSLAFLLVPFAAVKSNAQNKQPEVATVVQIGHVTEKEHGYSKEYNKLYPDRHGRKLSELSVLGRLGGNMEQAGVSIGVPLVPSLGGLPRETASVFLKDLTCKSGVVVAGSVQSKISHLTEDETFVYTEYDISVQEVIKNNIAAPIDVNGVIQATRPGGLIKLDDQIIRVEDMSYAPLEISIQYLLFLRFVPAANGYIVADARGDFVLDHDSFKSLSRLGVPNDLDSGFGTQALFRNLRTMVSEGCSYNIRR